MQISIAGENLCMDVGICENNKDEDICNHVAQEGEEEVHRCTAAAAMKTRLQIKRSLARVYALKSRGCPQMILPLMGRWVFVLFSVKDSLARLTKMEFLRG